MEVKKEKKFRNRSLSTLWSRDLQRYVKREAKRRSMTIDEYLKRKTGSRNELSENPKQETLDEPEIIEIKNIAPSDFELPKLDKVSGKKILIIDMVFDVSHHGEYVVINTMKNGHFITSSETVMRQLRRVAKNLTAQGKKLSKETAIRAKVSVKEATEGKYYILE